MKKTRHYRNNIAFLDVIFNLFLGFVVLFILALIHINPPVKQENIKKKAEVLIILEWPKNSSHDVDLWIKDPHDEVVWWEEQEIPGVFLARDDLGQINDTIYMPDGTKKFILLNQEVLSIRTLVPGEYVVNIHMYNKRTSSETEKEVPITTELIKVNPYKILDKRNQILKFTNDEITAFRFTVTEDGKIGNISYIPEDYVFDHVSITHER